jgi:hypothetical protein
MLRSGLVGLLAIACALSALHACEEQPDDPAGTGQSDGDTDSDADGDADGDADSDADSDADADGDTETDSSTFDECAALDETAQNELLPVDIVIAVDNSNSMELEAGWVQSNLNSLSAQIEVSGVDARIALISASSPGDDAGICIAPPLGSGTCPNDSNLPRYLHVPEGIGSNDALEKIWQTADQWTTILRDDSFVHFLVVTDDNSDWSPWEFINAMSGVTPPVTDFTFHAISSAVGWEDLTCIFNPLNPCCLLFAPAKGTVYEELVLQTGGVWGDLCLQDFQPIFDQLATVMSDVTIACEWDLPEPPEGETFDPTLVNVEFVDGQSQAHTLGYVADPADCSLVEHGWYYDCPDDPQAIHVCPQTCEWIQGQEGAEIHIILGCETVIADPE